MKGGSRKQKEIDQSSSVARLSDNATRPETTALNTEVGIEKQAGSSKVKAQAEDEPKIQK